MIRKLFFVLLPVLFVSNIFGQIKIDTAFIKKKLSVIRVRDQITKINVDSAFLMTKYDSMNLAETEKIIYLLGWP